VYERRYKAGKKAVKKRNIAPLSQLPFAAKIDAPCVKEIPHFATDAGRSTPGWKSLHPTTQVYKSK
jgi:hypothetical protein